MNLLKNLSTAFQISAFKFELSIVNCELSIKRDFQLSTFKFELSIVNCPLSIVNYFGLLLRTFPVATLFLPRTYSVATSNLPAYFPVSTPYLSACYPLSIPLLSAYYWLVIGLLLFRYSELSIFFQLKHCPLSLSLQTDLLGVCHFRYPCVQRFKTSFYQLHITKSLIIKRKYIYL